MRNPRAHKIDLALAEALGDNAPYLLTAPMLRAEAARKVVPRLTETELADSLRYHDEAGRLTSISGETGPLYTLNAQGRAWLAEHA